jgi:hypothetical protein
MVLFSFGLRLAAMDRRLPQRADSLTLATDRTSRSSGIGVGALGLARAALLGCGNSTGGTATSQIDANKQAVANAPKWTSLPQNGSGRARQDARWRRLHASQHLGLRAARPGIKIRNIAP